MYSIGDVNWSTSLYAPMEFMQALFRIGKGEPPAIPENLSRDARDFIQQCVHVNPSYCPTAADLLEYPFLRSPLYTSGAEFPMIGEWTSAVSFMCKIKSVIYNPYNEKSFTNLRA